MSLHQLIGIDSFVTGESDLGPTQVLRWDIVWGCAS